MRGRCEKGAKGAVFLRRQRSCIRIGQPLFTRPPSMYECIFIAEEEQDVSLWKRKNRSLSGSSGGISIRLTQEMLGPRM